jgi:hypothetical protein
VVVTAYGDHYVSLSTKPSNVLRHGGAVVEHEIKQYVSDESLRTRIVAGPLWRVRLTAGVAGRGSCWGVRLAGAGAVARTDSFLLVISAVWSLGARPARPGFQKGKVGRVGVVGYNDPLWTSLMLPLTGGLSSTRRSLESNICRRPLVN